MIVPIDIDNDGRMDILVQKESDGQRGINEISIIYNNMFTDSFYIQSSMYSQNQVNERHSAIIGGATFRYIQTTIDDMKLIRVDTQLPQCSFQSLILPYVYNGIGRSNGYLESFNVAYSHQGDAEQMKVFTPIIPNSQMYILASKGETDLVEWSLELFIQTDEVLTMLTLCALILLVIIGFVIIVMHIKEKKADERDMPQIYF